MIRLYCEKNILYWNWWLSALLYLVRVDFRVVGRDSRNLAVANWALHTWLNAHECVEMSVVMHSSAFMLSEPWSTSDFFTSQFS
jgi:hypothetical protein